jgi:ribosomal protein S18 acetylase RimI-like enzyme
MIDFNFKEFIDKEDLHILLCNCQDGKKYFRYFDKRNYDVLDNHLYNVLLYKKDNPIAYGHLDRDELNILWLGIIVADNEHGNGYGKKVLKMLVDFFMKIEDNELYLTVDKENLIAQKLYETFNFKKIKTDEQYFTYKLRK